MKTHQTGPFRQSGALKLLVLVPHRDARLPLRAWSGALFAAGVYGAWFFPWAAPLAILSRPFSADELKHCASALRERSLAGGNDGKITAGPAAAQVFPAGCFGEAEGDAALFGPVLNIAVPPELFSDNEAGKITCHFSPLVIGSALVRGFDTEKSALPPPPRLSFRAAALANMIFRPRGAGEGGCSFEWKTGKLYWLPPVKKKQRNRHG